MRERTIDNMKPWAAWMIRNHLWWLLMVMLYVFQAPLFLIIQAIRSLPEAWDEIKSVRTDMKQALVEVRAERDAAAKDGDA